MGKVLANSCENGMLTCSRFVALKGHKYLVDDESGQMMSTIVRKYLLGTPPVDSRLLCV